MSAAVAIVMPWRDTGCAHRARALEHIQARYTTRHPDWPITIGRHKTGPWIKALAVADALAHTQAAILILADADCWTDGLAAAVQAVREGAAWSVPHRGLWRLDEPSTLRWMAGESHAGLTLTERAYLGVAGGGIVVIRRDVYEGCPLDPRFIGWGGEDEAWGGFALRCLHGAAWRGKAPLIHCFHPSQQRACRSFGSMEGRDLRKRYARARSDPDAMKRLIQEVTPCRSPAS